MKSYMLKLQSENVGKRIERSMIVLSLALFLFSSIFSEGVFAQEKFPTRPITLGIGYAAGGSTDITVRSVSVGAAEVLGQPIIAANKPGGAGAVMLAGLKKEKPDGYNIGALTTGPFIGQYMNDLPFEVPKDFTPIMMYATMQHGIVVRSDSPWKTFQEFIEYAKANPGKIRYSAPGPGGVAHLCMAMLGQLAKVQWIHIPQDSTPLSIAALMGGHVEACSDSVFWKPHVMSGRLRVLAAYGDKRIDFAPGAPTVKELGYNVMQPAFFGITGPKGLSPQVLDTLHTALKKGLEHPDCIKALKNVDMEIDYKGPKEFNEYLLKLSEEVAPLMKRLGLGKK